MFDLFFNSGKQRSSDLACRSNADLTAMERQTRRKLNALRRAEPGNLGSGNAYAVWIGRNVAYIDALQRLRREQNRRAQML